MRLRLYRGRKLFMRLGVLTCFSGQQVFFKFSFFSTDIIKKKRLRFFFQEKQIIFVLRFCYSISLGLTIRNNDKKSLVEGFFFFQKFQL